VEAVKASSEVLVSHFFLFNNLGSEVKVGTERTSLMVSPEVYQTPIEKLELSSRTLNCLKRAHITKVGQVLEMTNEELLKIRNFGEKSLEELMDRLRREGVIGENERSTDGETTLANLDDAAALAMEEAGPSEPSTVEYEFPQDNDEDLGDDDKGEKSEYDEDEEC
jgi:DNA-directed RNA polymerase alpha subunit